MDWWLEQVEALEPWRRLSPAPKLVLPFAYLTSPQSLDRPQMRTKCAFSWTGAAP